MSTMDVKGAAEKWTYAEYASLPDDGNRYEVIDGEVCTTPAPGPPHQRVAAELFLVLRTYVQAHELGEMLWDVDLLFVAGQYLRPDMLLVPRDAATDVTDRGMEGVPGLVVEVLSPHSRHIDRIRKPPRYREFGIPEYWVVDPDGRAIERHRLSGNVGPEVCTETLTWQPDPDAPELELDVGSIFSGLES